MAISRNTQSIYRVQVTEHGSYSSPRRYPRAAEGKPRALSKHLYILPEFKHANLTVEGTQIPPAYALHGLPGGGDLR